MGRSWMTGAVVIVALALSGAACSHTIKGAKKDSEKIVEKTSAAMETFDVKSSLIADARVDSSNINVDTIAETKTVVLKGSVPTAAQRTVAEQIARRDAKGYRIDNRLTVVPKQ